MTHFIPVEGIAPLAFEPGCDYAYFVMQSAAGEQLYLAYASTRDFLSVPLTYQIICFSCSTVLEIHKMGIDEYLDGFEEDVRIPEPGFYQFEANDDGSDTDDDMAIFILADRASVLEIMYEHKDVHAEVYHCADAKTALTNLLSGLS